MFRKKTQSRKKLYISAPETQTKIVVGLAGAAARVLHLRQTSINIAGVAITLRSLRRLPPSPPLSYRLHQFAAPCSQVACIRSRCTISFCGAARHAFLGEMQFFRRQFDDHCESAARRL